MSKKLGVILAGFLTVSVNSFASSVDKEMIQLAHCSGIITGNSLIDYYITGAITKKELKDDIIMANVLYIDRVFKKNYKKDELMGFDSLAATARDNITQKANDETYGTFEFESVIKCYKKISFTLAKRMEKNDPLDDKVLRITEQQSEKIIDIYDALTQ